MNPTTNQIPRIVEIITKSSSGVIVLPLNPSLDATTAAISLYLGILKLGKTISVACSNAVNHDVTGVDKIQKALSTNGDNLVVSFPYTDGAIDKVDYNIEGNFFNLVITPRAGFSKLNPNQVKYGYTGGTVDYIITIDSPNLNNLGEIYQNNQTMFQGKNIINIDRHITNGFFGTVNYVDKSSSSSSEMILKVLSTLNIEIDKDMATNLYAGIMSATNNFGSYSVTAQTFESAANLLKCGAVKKTLPRQTNAPQTVQIPKINSLQSVSYPKEMEKQTVTPIESVEQAPLDEDTNTPQDWLKPKIFKGKGLL